MNIIDEIKKHLVFNPDELDNIGLWEAEERLGADHFSIEHHFWATPFRSGRIKRLTKEDIILLNKNLLEG